MSDLRTIILRVFESNQRQLAKSADAKNQGGDVFSVVLFWVNKNTETRVSLKALELLREVYEVQQLCSQLYLERSSKEMNGYIYVAPYGFCTFSLVA